jgi:hypothetical protein
MTTRIQAIRDFKESILPGLPSRDRPALRGAWNDYVDHLQKDGQISERAAATWDQPAFVKK